MEKVTFAPLKELLQENAESLNLALRSAGSVSRPIDTGRIPGWFIEVIEPVFQAACQHDSAKSRKLFDVLFRDMLVVLAAVSTGDELMLVRSCRLLLALNPALVTVNPTKTLAILTTALQRISSRSMTAARSWMNLMERLMPLVHNLNELMLVGRIAAWRCGMAHLRGMIDFSVPLDQRIVEILFPGNQGNPEDLNQRWGKHEHAATAVGGFVGTGGIFNRPPVLALNGDQVLVNDGMRTCILFADRFGTVLHDCEDAFTFSSAISARPITSAPAAIAGILGRYADLTSWVYHDSTLYLTTSSSYSVFLFGGVNG